MITWKQILEILIVIILILCLIGIRKAIRHKQDIINQNKQDIINQNKQDIINQKYDVLVYSDGDLIQEYISNKFPKDNHDNIVIYNTLNEPLTYIEGGTVIIKSRKYKNE